MVDINVFSEDILFAKMLINELKFSLGYENGRYVFALNPSSTRAHSSVCIVDLDSKYADGGLNAPNVVGFTSSGDALSSRKYSFCREIFVRPFLLGDFTLLISEILNEMLDGNTTYPVHQKNETVLSFEENNSVRFCGNLIHLSKNEYDILSLLNAKSGETVSRDEINSILGGECGNMSDVYICRIRSKLSAFCNKKLISTVRHKGYSLNLD